MNPSRNDRLERLKREWARVKAIVPTKQGKRPEGRLAPHTACQMMDFLLTGMEDALPLAEAGDHEEELWKTFDRMRNVLVDFMDANNRSTR